jgi:hypothetical protein
MKEIIRIISIWIIVLPVLAGFINYKGLNKDSRWIFFLVLIAAVPQLLTFTINEHTSALNLSYNLYTLVEMLVFYFLFANKFLQKSSRMVVYVSVAAYLLIAFYFFISKGIAVEFLNTLVCVNNCIYMLWILLLLKEQYQAKETLIVKTNPFMWYLLGILIYAPCSVIAFALYHYMREQNSGIIANLWVIQSICNILLYILFTIGLFIPKQKDAF